MTLTHDARRVSAARNVPLGALRTFVTLLVVAHHAALAYHAYAPPPPESLAGSQAWPAFPIVDPRRWGGAALLVGINDTFFMSLMFLVSGVFAWPSLVRKGPGRFLRDRTWRLGVPFVVSVLCLAPLAYYPTYLTTGAPAGAAAFARAWVALGMWYGGPAWFLWVLLAFGAIVSLLYAWAPGFGVRLGAFLGRLADRPVRFVALLILVSALAYLPVAAAFRPETWAHLGPFWIQTSRPVHYLVYFLVGVGLGAYGTDNGLLSPDGRFARRWPLWLAIAVVSFVCATIAVIAIVSTLEHGGPGLGLSTFGNLTFVLCCAGWSATVLALFLRFVTRTRRVMESLGANAYGIYVLHYICVTWLQYSLLPADLPGSVKFLLVLLGAVAASWALTSAARRLPAIARVIG